MILHQVYYTSCKRGLRGGAGFQINAASQGLDTATLSLIERFSAYYPPLRLAYDPSATPADFPTALSYYRIANHLCVIANSVFLGKSPVDARSGNFFTHSLISLDGPAQLEPLLPIQFWGGSQWMSQAVDTLELPDLTTPLEPTLDLTHIQQFLEADPRRPQALALLIAATLACLEHQQQLMLVAPTEECALWIAAITLSLPHTLAYQITFTTYAGDTAQFPYHIVGIDPESVRSRQQQIPPGSYIFTPSDSELTLSPALPVDAFASFVSQAYQQRNTKRLYHFLTLCNQLHNPLTSTTLNRFAELQQLDGSKPIGLPAIHYLVNYVITLFDEPYEVVAPLFRYLDQLDVREESVEDMVWMLFSAAYHDPAKGECSPEILTWFTNWVRQSFLPLATPQMLMQLSGRLKTTPLLPENRAGVFIAIRSHMGKGLKSLQQNLAQRIDREQVGASAVSTNVAAITPPALPQLLALLEFTSAIGMEHALGTNRRVLFGALVPYIPIDTATADVFAERVKLNDSTVIDILYTALIEQSSEPDNLRPWSAFLSDPAVHPVLLNRSIAEPCPPLYLFLQMQQLSDPVGRTPFLKQVLQALDQAFPSLQANPELVERWYIEQMYPEPTIHPYETRSLLSIVDKSFLSQSCLLGKMIAGALKDPDLYDEEFYKSIDHLQAAKAYRQSEGRELRNETSETVWMIHLTKWYAYVRNTTVSTEHLIHLMELLLETIPPEGKRMSEQVLTISVEVALDQPLFDQTLQHMLVQLATYEPEIWRALGNVIKDWSADIPSDGTFRFYTLFRQLTRFEMELSSRSALMHIDQPLRTLWQAFPSSDQKLIDEQLGRGSLAHKWQEWRREGKQNWLARWFKRG